MHKNLLFHIALVAGFVMDGSIKGMEDPKQAEELSYNVDRQEEKTKCFELLFTSSTPNVRLCVQAAPFNVWRSDDGWKYLDNNESCVSEEPIDQFAYFLIPNLEHADNEYDVNADKEKFFNNLENAAYYIVDSNKINHPRAWLHAKENRTIHPQLFVQVEEDKEKLVLRQQDLVLGGFGEFMRTTIPFTKGLADQTRSGCSIAGRIGFEKIIKLRHIFFDQTEKNREKRKARIQENLAALLQRVRKLNPEYSDELEIEPSTFQTVCNVIREHLAKEDMAYKYLTSNEFNRALTEIHLQPNKTLEQ